MGTDHEHVIATFEEAEAAIRAHDVIFLNDCFCRGPAKEGKEDRKWCGHPVETCLGFHGPLPDWPEYEYHEIPQAEALEIFTKWRDGGGFFRFMEDKEWICCCCSCGCGWFRDKEGNPVEDPCKKSPMIEQTDLETCTLCEECVELCAWGARSIEDEQMLVDRDNCYGCTACAHHCPEEAIAMTPR